MGWGEKRLWAIAATAVVVAGCGGGEQPPPPPPPPAAQTPPPGAPPARSVTVRMEKLQFVPREVRVAAGGTVEWKNTDTPPHTVTKQEGPGRKFDSGTLQPGQSFRQSFREPGRFDYVCTIHPGQTGTVIVE